MPVTSPLTPSTTPSQPWIRPRRLWPREVTGPPQSACSGSLKSWLPAMMVLLMRSDALEKKPANVWPVRLPVIVLPTTVAVPVLETPPASKYPSLVLIVSLISLRTPRFVIPPPYSPELLPTTDRSSVSIPLFEMPPASEPTPDQLARAAVSVMVVRPRLRIPPPRQSPLPAMVLLVTVRLPAFSIAFAVVLPLRLHLISVAVPEASL